MLNYTTIEIIQIFLFPLIAIITPVIFIGIRIIQKQYSFSHTWLIKLKLGIYWFLIFTLIFSVLVYLTGGVGIYYRLEKGIFIDDRQIVWNITSRLNFVVPFNPGTGLFAISVLAGLLYASMLALPKHCQVPIKLKNTIPDETMQQTKSISTMNKVSSTTSSITSAGSALTSVPVCCSTSIVSVILPTTTALLAPIAPILMVGSLGLMLFQVKRNVFPRFKI